jgi:nuclear pore complex protein Nup155
LTIDNLETAVGQYTALRYYAGAIQLCLLTAQEKDRGNTALAWTRENRPENDGREAAYLERKSCYELVHKVLEALDEAADATAAAAAVAASGHGNNTAADRAAALMATKRAEAYDVVNGSEDEVFHFDLYQWYIAQGWTDRLLTISSPHVVTFLQQLAVVSVDHAELLCRYYTLRDRFYEAGKVQCTLAQSDFDISLKDRITLLSQARGNAMVTTQGVSRQLMQQLSHRVTEMLEIAHVQDDLLERLRLDGRVDADRLVEIERMLDGKTLTMSEVRRRAGGGAVSSDCGTHDG